MNPFQRMAKMSKGIVVSENQGRTMVRSKPLSCTLKFFGCETCWRCMAIGAAVATWPVTWTAGAATLSAKLNTFEQFGHLATILSRLILSAGIEVPHIGHVSCMVKLQSDWTSRVSL